MEVTTKNFPGFHIAAFGIDGQLEGMCFRKSDDLSRKWLAICSDFLSHHGPDFDATWGSTLAHISTRISSASGCALVTFSVWELPACSMLLACGQSEAAEQQILESFVESLRRTNFVKAATTLEAPFQALFDVAERPLLAVVPWAQRQISDQDHGLVQELSIHLAGAYFRHVGVA